MTETETAIKMNSGEGEGGAGVAMPLTAPMSPLGGFGGSLLTPTTSPQKEGFRDTSLGFGFFGTPPPARKELFATSASPDISANTSSSSSSSSSSTDIFAPQPIVMVTPPPAPAPMLMTTSGELTAAGVLSCFQASAVQISQLTTSTHRLYEMAGTLNNNVMQLSRNQQELKKELQVKCEEFDKKLGTIAGNQTPWVLEVSNKPDSRKVLSFVVKHVFNTYSGQVAGIPFYSTADNGAENPDLLVGIHIGLANIMFKHYYKDFHGAKLIDAVKIKTCIQNLLGERFVTEADYVKLNSTAPLFFNKKTKDLARDLKNPKPWVCFQARKLPEAFLFMESCIPKLFENPLPPVDEDSKKPMTVPKNRGPASQEAAYKGPATRMAFQYKLWQECMDEKAWADFIAIMQPVITSRIADKHRASVTDYFNTPGGPPLRHIQFWCVPILPSIPQPWAAVEEKVAPPRRRASKRKAEAEAEVEEEEAADEIDIGVAAAAVPPRGGKGLGKGGLTLRSVVSGKRPSKAPRVQQDEDDEEASSSGEDEAEEAG